MDVVLDNGATVGLATQGLDGLWRFAPADLNSYFDRLDSVALRAIADALDLGNAPWRAMVRNHHGEL